MIFETKVQYTNEDRLVKEQNVVEGYDLFAEVEARMCAIFHGYKDLDVVAIKRSNIKEIANQRTSNNDVVWQAEVQDIFHDDEGNEKLLKYKILFFSKTYESANTFITEYAKQGYDMSLVSLKLTKFIDVL